VPVCQLDLVILSAEIACCGDKINVIICIVIFLELDW
jgi:hypothetical protein